MNVFASWQAKDFAHKGDDLAGRNDPEGVRRLAQKLEGANELWKSWALSVGGSVVVVSGPSGVVQVPIDRISTLPAIKDQYQEALDGALTTVGMGMELSQSQRTLQMAAEAYPGSIVFYSPEVEAYHLRKEKAEGEEMSKAMPALNQGAGAGISGASRPAGAAAPTSPVEGTASHSQGEAIYSMLQHAKENQPPAAELTHAARDLDEDPISDEDLEQEFHHHADAHAQSRTRQEQSEELRSKVVEILQEVRKQAPLLEQIKQTSPETFKAVSDTVKILIEMARQFIAPANMAKSEDLEKAAKKYPQRMTDEQMFDHVSRLHLGSRADLNKVPVDVNFRLVQFPLERLPANYPSSDGTVVRYSQLKTPYPPITIGLGGRIPDGHHRITAAKLRGDKTIAAYVPEGELPKYETLLAPHNPTLFKKPVKKSERRPVERDQALLAPDELGKGALPESHSPEDVSFTEVSPDLFERAISQHPSQHTLDQNRTYKGKRTFLNQSGTAGYALEPSGYFGNLFSLKRGLGAVALKHAISTGATHGNAFESLMPYYQSHGFQEVAREPNWTPGGPDVVHFALPGMVKAEPHTLRSLESGRYIHAPAGKGCGCGHQGDDHEKEWPNSCKKRGCDCRKFRLSKAEKLVGGAADGARIGDFDRDSLIAGALHEMEHTKDIRAATEIAMDHLTEDPDYYRKIQGIEKASLEATEPDPAKPVPEGKDLEKMNLAPSHPPTREHLNLPAGTALEGKGKVKVQDVSGHQHWVQVRSGQVMSQNPEGHPGQPVSSRNPNGT